MITGLSHVSIAVPSLEAAARRLKELYGLDIGPVRVNEQQGVRLAYVELPNARIELMEPSRPDSPVAKSGCTHTLHPFTIARCKGRTYTLWIGFLAPGQPTNSPSHGS